MFEKVIEKIRGTRGLAPNFPLFELVRDDSKFNVKVRAQSRATAGLLLPYTSNAMPQTDISREWFYSIQKGVPFVGSGSRECPQCPEFIAPTTKWLSTKSGGLKKEGWRRKCEECEHMHVPVRSFADLKNRSVSLHA